MPYTLALVNQELVKSSYESLTSTRNFVALAAFNVNTASLAGSILCNKSLFIPQILTSFLRFFNHTRHSMLLTSSPHLLNSTTSSITSSFLDTGGGSIISYKKCPNNVGSALVNLFSSTKLGLFRLVLRAIFNIRLILIKLILLNLFT